MDIELSEEIERESNRIKSRQKQIENDIGKLSKKIICYTRWAWFFVVSGLVIGVFTLYVYFDTPEKKNFYLNILGDSMGGTVASIWSLAGLFFIYVAFLGQKQQLLNQQLEIMYSQLEVKYTRLELAGQKEEMREQNLTLRQQRFENTFFQLLNLFNSIINSIDLTKSINNNRLKEFVVISGRDCFKDFYEHLEGCMTVYSIRNKTPANLIESVVGGYDYFYEKNKSDIGHYFMTLYHIVKMIDKSNIADKKQYTSIVRAQLSSYELVMLFYNCLHESGKKFKPLVERYALLKNIDFSLLLNQEHKEEYQPSAYGD